MRIDEPFLGRRVVMMLDRKDLFGSLLVILGYRVPAFAISIRHPAVIVNTQKAAKGAWIAPCSSYLILRIGSVFAHLYISKSYQDNICSSFFRICVF